MPRRKKTLDEINIKVDYDIAWTNGVSPNSSAFLWESIPCSTQIRVAPISDCNSKDFKKVFLDRYEIKTNASQNPADTTSAPEVQYQQTQMQGIPFSRTFATVSRPQMSLSRSDFKIECSCGRTRHLPGIGDWIDLGGMEPDGADFLGWSEATESTGQSNSIDVSPNTAEPTDLLSRFLREHGDLLTERCGCQRPQLSSMMLGKTVIGTERTHSVPSKVFRLRFKDEEYKVDYTFLTRD